MDPKAIAGIFVGYDVNSKVCRCFIPEKGKVDIFRDVKLVDALRVSMSTTHSSIILRGG